MAEEQDILIRKKLRLLQTGLYGFIGCLVLTFFSLVLQVIITMWQAILGIENAGSWLMSLGLIFMPVFFAGAFVFFGIIIAAAVKEPRSVDMGGLMKNRAGSIASFFITGVLLNTLPLLGTLAGFFGVLYYKGESVIFLALCYFVISCALFFAAVGYAMVRSVGGAAGPGPDAPVMKRIVSALRPGALSDRSRRVLTLVERVLGSALGIVLYLLFSAGDLYENARSITGHGSDRTWLDKLASTGGILAIFALFIFVFSTLFIIKAVKTAFASQPAVQSGPVEGV